MSSLSKSLSDTAQIAQDFLNSISLGDEAAVVALEGNLGSGKTTFTQAVGKILGINENMTSPTFVIMKVYEINFRGFKSFIHIDAYRLEKESELTHLGWKEMIKEPENLIFIEWPQNVPGVIPPTARKVSLEFVDENTRQITLHEKS